MKRPLLLLVLALFLPSICWATTYLLRHTFQVVNCDFKSGKHSLVPVFFGSFGSSPEAEFAAISDGRLMVDIGVGNRWRTDTNLNLISSYGISVSGTHAGLTGPDKSDGIFISAIIDISKAKQPHRDFSDCSIAQMIEATFHAIFCVAKSKSYIDRLQITVRDRHKNTVGNIRHFSMKTEKVKCSWDAPHNN